jgi:hypothetical protein
MTYERDGLHSLWTVSRSQPSGLLVDSAEQGSIIRDIDIQVLTLIVLKGDNPARIAKA